MKNPFPTNPSPGDIFLAGPVRISQIHGERSPRIWTLEQCRYAAHAINQHEKLVAELEQVNSEAGDAVSECNRLRDLLQTCEAANKCLSMRVGVQATDLAQQTERDREHTELLRLRAALLKEEET